MSRKTSPVLALVSLSALAVLLTAGKAFAGPLAPPAGPVGSSYKTLNEVEPRIAINATNTPGDADSVFKITQPGSYYLVGNLTGALGKNGIEIAASRVTIDLNGFKLTGVSGSLSGVAVTLAGQSGITVLNGSAQSWGGSGIDLAASSPTQLRVERIHSSGNAAGIRAYNNATVVDCSASQNTGRGFDLYSNVIVTQCRADSNGSTGFDVAGHAMLSLCQSTNNGGLGFIMVAAGTVTQCEASGNSNYGIQTGPQSTVRDCTITNNDRGGIKTVSSCVISRNNISDNSADANSSGIEATGSYNRIEDNTLVDNTIMGMRIMGTNNIIVRNTVSGSNSPWYVEFGNRCFVTLWGPGGMVVGGSGGTQSPTTDPNANFTVP